MIVRRINTNRLSLEWTRHIQSSESTYPRHRYKRTARCSSVHREIQVRVCEQCPPIKATRNKIRKPSLSKSRIYHLSRVSGAPRSRQQARPSSEGRCHRPLLPEGDRENPRGAGEREEAAQGDSRKGAGHGGGRRPPEPGCGARGR